MTKICSRCGAAIEEGGKFCPSCGAPAETASPSNSRGTQFCPNCGTAVESGQKFCPSCGAALIQKADAGPQGSSEEPEPPRQSAPFSQVRRTGGTPAGGVSPFDILSARQGLAAKLGYMFLDYEGRLNRKPYFIWGLILGVALSILQGLMGVVAEDYTIFNVFILAISILQMVASFSLIIRRCHDLNHSGWYSLTLFIPIFNIYVIIKLLFFRGTIGPNKYGPDPLGIES